MIHRAQDRRAAGLGRSSGDHLGQLPCQGRARGTSAGSWRHEGDVERLKAILRLFNQKLEIAIGNKVFVSPLNLLGQ